MNDVIQPRDAAPQPRHYAGFVVIGAVLVVAAVIFTVFYALNALSSTPTASVSQTSASPSPSVSSAAPDPSVNYDWDSLKGKKLSNAYALLDNAGIDISALNVSTVSNDGKTVLNRSRWTITDVSFTKPDKVLFTLHHDTDATDDTVDKGLDALKSGAATVKDKATDLAANLNK